MSSSDRLDNILAWVTWYLFCGLCFGGISALMQLVFYLSGEGLSFTWVVTAFIIGMVVGSTRYFFKEWYE